MKHTNGQIWYDDQGNSIQAHGGCILQHNACFYWYGEHKGADNVPNTTRVDVIGISCYSSKDLHNWHYEGLALPAVPPSENSLLRPSCVCERPKVLYNAQTRKFVMWVHLDDAAYSQAKVGVAVSNTPTGPFTLVREMQPNRQDSRDFTLFAEDNTAWLIHSSNWNKTLNIARLTKDYTNVDGFYTSVLVDQEREAPALVKHNGLYYMITSGCTSWAPNSALFATCPYLTGQWKLIDNPCEGPRARETFGGQSTYIFEAGGTHYLMLDHWNPCDLKSSGYSILPIAFRNDTVTVKWESHF